MTKGDLYCSYAELVASIILADGVYEHEEHAVITSVLPAGHALLDLIPAEISSSSENLSLVSAYKEIVEYIKIYPQDTELKLLITLLEKLSKVSKYPNVSAELIENIIENLKEKIS